MNLPNLTSMNAINTNAASSEVLFVTECSSWGERGYKAVSSAFGAVQPIYWSHGMPKPDLSGWHGDWIISFKADLVLPRAILERAKKGAINFHPAPPKYRGLGGYWWALRNNDDAFGVTLHHMDDRIDHGEIIKVKNFPILPNETMDSLKERTAAHALQLLIDTVSDLVKGEPLTSSNIGWEPHLYTSQELAQAQRVHVNHALHVLEVMHGEMNEVEMEKRQGAA